MLARLFSGPVRFYIPTGTKLGVGFLNRDEPAQRVTTNVMKEIRESHITDIRPSEVDGSMLVHFRGSIGDEPAVFVAHLSDLVKV